MYFGDYPMLLQGSFDMGAFRSIITRNPKSST
jgi:hypothetical protein